MEANKINSLIESNIIDGNLDNNEMIQIIELVGNYLNLQTISDYVKTNSISYNGAKKFRTVKTIFNTKFIIDNH